MLEQAGGLGDLTTSEQDARERVRELEAQIEKVSHMPPLLRNMFMFTYVSKY
jgi:hypothetical protein